MTEKKATTHDEVAGYLNNWSDRKKTMFTNPKFIDIAIKNIQTDLSLPSSFEMLF